MCVSFAPRRPAHKPLLPHWLIHFGLIGVFGVSAVDSSVIPLPLPGSTDLLVLVLAANEGNPWLLAIAAVAGSLIGGYLSWKAGERGGEAMLQRYLPEHYLRHIENWVKRNGVFTVGAACLLPPPIPLMPFLISAGALGMSRNRFMASFGGGRTIRYGLVAWLGATYGRSVIRTWHRYLAGWSDVILWSFIGLVIAAVVFGIWKYRHDQRKETKEHHARPALESNLPAQQQ
jgi:membrane protein DedA with SNARE-associated domain